MIKLIGSLGMMNKQQWTGVLTVLFWIHSPSLQWSISLLSYKKPYQSQEANKFLV